MIFIPRGKYGMLSEDGRYSVAAYREPISRGWIYQAWRVKDLEVLHTGTDQDCRAACVRDAQ